MSRLATPTFATRAIVLRVRPLGEKDRALTLLCEDGNKLSASARGARGAKSKLAAMAQPFTMSRLLLARGKTFAIVQQAQIERVHARIAADFGRAAWAFYCCELCDALPEELPEAEVFTLLAGALQAFDDAPDGDAPALEAAARWFEARFLSLLGYSPQLGRCGACGAKIVIERDEGARRVAFSPSAGATLCSACRTRDGARLDARADALRAWHRLERASQPPAAWTDKWELPLSARRDLRDALRASLRAHLGLRLRSQRFIDDLDAGAG